REPLGIKRAYAWKLIAAKRVRMLLPDLNSTRVESGGWTEAAIRPLTHSDFSTADQKRLGRKIAKRVENGEKLTAALVKSICDEDRGVERRKAEKQQQEITETPTPFGIIKQMRGQALAWLQSLKEVPSTFWTDAEHEEPGSVQELSEIYVELAAFLGTNKKPR
ncbi:MAG: hypothetical protein KDB01_12155, partial [Planctomycetaceae bacterium]|nr:hypothetical protein [Planctomycetaceae bacterium]